jgi:hypothetical protein
MVMAEVDIAVNGSITVTPNPLAVPSGENLFFHVNSNASDAARLSVHFPGGPKSPFGAIDMNVDMTASRCTAGGTLVRWPPDVERASVTLSAHGSPAIGELEVEIRYAGPAHPVEVHPLIATAGKVTPQGPAGDQAYALTIEDPKITTDSDLAFDLDPSGCVKVQSSAVSDGEAVVVVECVKEGGRCKVCKTIVAVTVVDKSGGFLTSKKFKVSCAG